MQVERVAISAPKEKKKLVVEHLLCGSLLLFPSFTLFPSLPVYVCVCVLGAFNSVEATSNVSLPVEMAAVCSIVVID